MSRPGVLTNEDHHNMNNWFEKVIEEVKSGTLTMDQAIGDIGQMVGAIDIDNMGEVRAWIEGRNPLKD